MDKRTDQELEEILGVTHEQIVEWEESHAQGILPGTPSRNERDMNKSIKEIEELFGVSSKQLDEWERDATQGILPGDPSEK